MRPSRAARRVRGGRGGEVGADSMFNEEVLESARARPGAAGASRLRERVRLYLSEAAERLAR